MQDSISGESHCPRTKLNRRQAIAAGGAVAACIVGGYWIRNAFSEKYPVFLANNQHYDGPLDKTILDGLTAVGFDPQWVRGRNVLLKPNIVDPLRSMPHITTDPSVIRAAADVFRRWGAHVTIGEAAANVRDSELLLYESRLEETFHEDKLNFIDLNYSEFRQIPNAGGYNQLPSLTFPCDALHADLIVSMPKLKTHHWAGMTASMKNLFGVMPGQIYGWPKNILHYAGIPETVVDINASLPHRIAIVDGILCMEGDGPLMGTPKSMGLLAIGLNLTALDATLARVIGLDPYRIPYLALSDGLLGALSDRSIVQRGEAWQGLVDPFNIINVPFLQNMRAGHS